MYIRDVVIPRAVAHPEKQAFDERGHDSHTEASMLPNACLLSHNNIYCNRYDPQKRTAPRYGPEQDDITQMYDEDVSGGNWCTHFCFVSTLVILL